MAILWHTPSIYHIHFFMQFTPKLKGKQAETAKLRNFVGCQELCGDDFECLSSCQRQYVQCSESCPCNKECLNGCYKCENAVCENCSVSTSERTNVRRK